MLERSISQLEYSDDDKKSATFYIADSRGIPIWTADTISTDDSEKQVLWTLSNYISYSNIWYPSKAKFYCVRKGT